MSRTISKNSSDVPKIVITEPSPVPVENAAGKVPPSILTQTPQTSTEPAIEVESAPVSEPQSHGAEDLAEPVSERVVLDTSGGFLPSLDNPECTVNVEEADSGSNQSPSAESTGAESSVDEPRSRRTFCDIWCQCFEYLVNTCWNSKLVVPIQLLLLSMPISASYMGSTYMSECPMSAATPFFVFMMGVTGCMVIMSRTLLYLRNTYVPELQDASALSTICIVGNIAMVLFQITEIVSFMGRTPSFLDTDPNYCHETFYKYTYYMNYFATVYLILMIVLCVPNSCPLPP